VLQLHKTEDGTTEYAEFLHAPKKRFSASWIWYRYKEAIGVATS